MAESKSDYFSSEINAHSEKFAKFDPLSIKSLAADTEHRELNKLSKLIFSQN